MDSSGCESAACLGSRATAWLVMMVLLLGSGATRAWLVWISGPRRGKGVQTSRGYGAGLVAQLMGSVRAPLAHCLGRSGHDVAEESRLGVGTGPDWCCWMIDSGGEVVSAQLGGWFFGPRHGEALPAIRDDRRAGGGCCWWAAIGRCLRIVCAGLWATAWQSVAGQPLVLGQIDGAVDGQRSRAWSSGGSRAAVAKEFQAGAAGDG